MTIADLRRGAWRGLCFLLALVIVFCVVAFPLAVPALAVAGIDDVLVMLAGTVYLSMGYSFTVTPEALQNICNAFVSDMLEHKGSGYDEMMEIRNRIESAYEGGKYATVDIRRSEYAEISNAIEAWTKLHTSEDGMIIKVDVANAPPILLKKENAYKGSVFSAISVVNSLNLATQSDVQNFLGSSVVVFGNADGFVLDRSYMESSWSKVCVSCDKWGGKGGHYIWLSIKPDGTVLNLPTVCYGCKDSDPSDSALVFFGEKSAGVYDVFYGLCSSARGASIGGSYTVLRSNVFSTPIEVPGVGSVDVPVEKDKAYEGGVVSGSWDTLIGQVGAVADSLPFNIPMGGLDGLRPSDVLPKDLIQSGSIDVPDVGEGEIEMPSVDALKLPAGITTKFPFCIPFDLYRAMAILNAPPVAPRFVIPLKYGDLVDEEIVLDFEGFEFLIALVRWFEFGLFCVGLAAATRYLIKV